MNNVDRTPKQKTHSKQLETRLMLNRTLYAMICLFACTICSAQVAAPPPPQSKTIVIHGATLHTVSGETISEGTLVFADGKFVAVGDDTDTPADAVSIDLGGKHIYPGLFEAHSQIGLTEISSVSATIDHSETGNMNPNVKAIVAVNPESDIIGVTRAGGVLIAVTAPGSGVVSGQAAVIQLDGWTYEDMTVSAEAAMVVNWPSFGRRRRFGPPQDDEPSTSSRVDELKKLFEDARRYQELRKDADANQAFDLRLESLDNTLSGKTPLYVRADALADIEAAVAFAVEQNVRIIILGGYDAPLCAELLKKHDVPVVVSAVYRMPRRQSDPDDHAYTLPRRLDEAGIRFCISSTDRSETWNTRNLPFHAGTAIAHGLDADSALKSVTLYPAQIFDVDDRLGSLEVGKDATFIVTDGDPLDTRTNIEKAFVQGREIDLSSRHTRLYEKYKLKYDQLKSND